MKRRIVRVNGYEVKIGSNMTLNDVVVEVTDKFVDNNTKHFDIEYLIKDLKNYTDKLDSYSHWSLFKKQEPRLYWLKIFTILAYEINKYSKGDHIKYFITKEHDDYKYRNHDKHPIKPHATVRYNLTYFNTMSAAKEAKQIMGDFIKYVV